MLEVRVHDEVEVGSEVLGGNAVVLRFGAPSEEPVGAVFEDAVGEAQQDWSAWLEPEAGGELSWQERSLCAQTDPEAFFPEKGGSTREAKKVCVGCEVRAECLEYALANDERFGIWGGLSERERRKLKKRAV